MPLVTTMATLYLFPCLLFFSSLASAFGSGIPIKPSVMDSFPCNEHINTCNALLYHINQGLPVERIASFYSANPSQIKPIFRGNQKDYLITVPCSCKDVNSTRAMIYSGQAWKVGGEENYFIAGVAVPIHLLCGCVETGTQVVVTYTVQQQDTLSIIATLLSAEISGIESMNKMVAQNPGYIDVCWVLFVPMELNGLPTAEKSGKTHKWVTVIALLSAVALFSVITLIIILLRRKRPEEKITEDAKHVSKAMSITTRAFSSQGQCKENTEDVTVLESERTIIFSLEEIEEATNNFDESRIIGRGGFGNVYFGLLGDREAAIKKMRSNKSKEFFAELKVLCKIHHINVFISTFGNGSLSDHLHDPLLKGHQPLTWTARTQIALDAAKGIEYIHDHTKARYVHRDIKTSNILLDDGLRAKVADFGLVKLEERTNEKEMLATRLVGTPGYLPPEYIFVKRFRFDMHSSVMELQVTTKTDVFAFGVVLAELITGKRALIRDDSEPTKMKSLITIMAAVAEWCLNEDAVDRPEMRDIVAILSQIMITSTEWEASLGGDSQVFSGLFNGR
ncbi:hypothetical protein CISIN_1g044997mg [Citrus sinensis]|uniref:Protein kinase domain-containing protein n=1 Tax=Citrus sinensis TaxID=2711 RepID=A0A067GU95_CITSI|nr:hypothetical protein CISIN_1g044997mg [Citrus sinensis]